MTHKNIKDLTGQKFGKLTVKHLSLERDLGGRCKWVCLCECGKEKTVMSWNLVAKKTVSCGCQGVSGKSNLKHGKVKTSEYKSWSSLKERCLNINNPAYPRYGGRGISVCERWLNSFENFYADMGPKPSPSHSIERVENSGNYEPSNCIWATKKKQSQNRRNIKKVIDNSTGVIYVTIKEASDSFDFKPYTLARKLNGTTKNNTTLSYL
jgi:hypothetical protein